VRDAMTRALTKARAGQGATLIEALTYRLHDHTTADDATRYRDADEVAEAWRLEPIGRLRNFLSGQKLWSKKLEERLIKDCAEKVQTAVETYLATPAPEPSHMFDHLYASLPSALKAQRDAAQGHG
ncbi:MAG: thiamine pyrophosphate-dependent enzyme, partial [Burkholderiales bacterium]